VKSPHIQADYHLKLRPGTNVAAITAMAHVDRERRTAGGKVYRRTLRAKILC